MSPVVLAILLAVSAARAQYGPPPAGAPSADSPASRYHAERTGRNLDQWQNEFDSPDANLRLQVMDDIGRSIDPRAATFLLKALDDSDPRIQAKAIDYLGRRRSSDATSVLVQKLFLTGAPTGMRQHVLTALGKIGDPAASRSILDFLAQERNPEVRGTAIYALGELGDLTIQDDLRKLAEAESDPKLRQLIDETLAKITTLPRPKLKPGT